MDRSPTARPGVAGPARLLATLAVTTVLSAGAVSVLPADGDVDAARPRMRVIALINHHRVEAGLRPLRLAPKVHRAAQRHSRDQARMGRMTHTGSNGSSCGDRLTRQGYRWSSWGENVAMGYPTARAVVRAWMGSSSHRANILNRAFRHVGVGLRHSSNGTPYWTLDFARPG